MKQSAKKSILFIPLLIVFIIVTAQNKVLQIYKGGDVVQSISVSNIDSIMFVDSSPIDEKGVVINGVRWAICNIGEPGTFTASPEIVGKYYQWNKIKPWDANETVDNWDSSIPSGSTWSLDQSPCPAGWRLPTIEEMKSLIDAGSMWTTVNGVPGRKFGNGDNSIFIPAGGYLDNGILRGSDSQIYWTSNRYNDDVSNILFGTSDFVHTTTFGLTYGLPIRCVAVDPQSEIIEVTSVQLNIANIDLKVGDSYKLVATVLPTNATDQTVTWKSIFPEIVSVDENGLVTALAEGEGLIGAYAGNEYAICTVNVYSANLYDEGVIINGVRWATRNVGEPGKFAESPESSGMLYQWNKYAGWSTTDGSVSIPEGSVWETAEVGEEEYLDIDAHWESENSPCPEGWRVPTRTELESLISAGYKSEIRNGVVGIVFGSGDNSIFMPFAGSRSRFLDHPSGYGSGGHYWSDTPNPNMRRGNVFSLSIGKIGNTYKANVNGPGDIYDGYSIRCVADNYIPVSSIKLNKTNLSLDLGSYEQLTATVFPTNASNTSVVWTSSNESVATVNGNTGNVYAKSPGNATIIAQVDNQTATCDVRVYGTAQTGLKLNKNQICLKVGESYSLVATITPPDATFNTVKWTSLDPSIATVDQTGKIVAVKEGTTSINAATKSMSTSCKVIVDKIGGDGGHSSSPGDSDNITGKTFSSAQLYYYGNYSSSTTYFRLSLFNQNEYDGLVIEGFCDNAYSFSDFILDPATYTFSSVYGTPKTFIEGEFFGDPSTDGRYMGTYYYKSNGCILFDGGTISISKSGDKYTISTNLSGYSNASTSTYKNLNFKYSGVPEKINFFK